MTVDLKANLRHWLEGDSPLDREGVEQLRAAGLLTPIGYVITEAGRALMIQKPSTNTPVCDNTQTIKPVITNAEAQLNSLFGKLAGGTISPMSMAEFEKIIAAGGQQVSTVSVGGGAPQFGASHITDSSFTGAQAAKNNELRQMLSSATDTQVGGDHYKKLGHHQPWEVLATWLTPEELRGYMKGTVIAYLAREQDKGGDTDVAKSLHTMQLWQEVRKDK